MMRDDDLCARGTGFTSQAGSGPERDRGERSEREEEDTFERSSRDEQKIYQSVCVCAQHLWQL